MGDKRSDGYINLDALYGAPRPDSGGLPRPDPTRGPVFVSHELQLRRDLEIANARIAAELGPLPSGGLPVQFKPRIGAKGRPLPQLSNAQTYEEEAMNLKQVPAAVAMTAALAACEPQVDIASADQTQRAAPAAERAAPVASETQAPPKAAAAPEHITADAAPAVPDEIRAFVPPDSTLLAYKRFDLTGDGNEDAVLIVHRAKSSHVSASSNNPCDLVVLHGEKSGFKIVGKNSKAVDCVSKDYLEPPNKPDDLNYMLKLSRREIACNYEADRPMGASTFYTFKFSEQRKSWHLSQARHAYKSYDDNWRLYLAIEEIDYPSDFGFIGIDEFDPDALKAEFKQSKEIEFFGDGEEESVE